MKLSSWIRKEAVLTGMESKDKWQVLDQLVDQLVKVDLIDEKHKSEVQNAIATREKSMSTGMEKGIAIPHAAVDGVEELCISLGVAPDGIPFDSIDGEPASIIILLVIPRSKKLMHIRTLAEVARLLSREALRKKILAGATPEDVLAAIADEESREPVNG